MLNSVQCTKYIKDIRNERESTNCFFSLDFSQRKMHGQIWQMVNYYLNCFLPFRFIFFKHLFVLSFFLFIFRFNFYSSGFRSTNLFIHAHCAVTTHTNTYSRSFAPNFFHLLFLFNSFRRFLFVFSIFMHFLTIYLCRMCISIFTYSTHKCKK